MAEVRTTSEQQTLDDIFKLIDAGGAVIQLRSREVLRTAQILRKGILNSDDYSHSEWDVANGMRRFSPDNYTDSLVSGAEMQFPAALKEPLDKLRDANSVIRKDADKTHVYVYVDPHPFINGNPYSLGLIQLYASALPNTNVCVIFVTPEVEFQGLPLGTVLIADASTPNGDELGRSLKHLLAMGAQQFEMEDVSDEEIEQIAVMGQGMTLFEFETYVSISMIEASTDNVIIDADTLLEGVAKGKTQVVKQSDILELFHTEDMGDVGGMHRLKNWIEARANNFTDEAREYGIEPPKGVAIVGVPGTGKSLIAKAIASTLGVPLIRLDFGRVFSKFIGDSESRMRSSLKMLESMGRVVLFADEIDKGLGGIGGGGDSGTSSRVLGAFLTWMQENKTGVFTILTANKIEGLPPELFRKGRMDAVFSVGLPNSDERREVLGVHLRKRGRKIEDFDDAEIRSFLSSSRNYTPAEIEAAVKDALILAYNDENAEDIQITHINKALADMVPMSVSHAEQIDAIMDWASKNATPVSYEEGKGPKATEAPVEEAKPTSRLRARRGGR